MPTSTPSKATLGRGTSTDIQKGRSNVFRIDRKRCVFDKGFNPRIDFGDIEVMAAQIRDRGIQRECFGHLGPDGKFHITDGERRIRGLDLAIERKWVKGELALVPVKPDPRHQTDAERTLATIILNSGKPLTMLEQGTAMHRLLKEHGYTHANLQAQTGHSITHIHNCLSLIEGPCPSLAELLRNDHISSTTAVEIVREVPELEKQEEIVRQAIAAAAAAEAPRITAKHLPILIGHEAQAERKRRATEEAAAEEERKEKELVEQAIVLVQEEGKASTALLQRRLKIGYTRAVQILEALEQRGIVGPGKAGATREVFDVLEDGDADTSPTGRGRKRSASGEGDSDSNSDPFDGKETVPDTAVTNERGEFIEGILDRPIATSAKGVSIKVQLASREEQWFYGFILKWPGKSKEDGFLKVAPSIHSLAFRTSLDCEISAVQSIRAELETHEFKSRGYALADLDTKLRELAALLPSTSSPQQAAPPERDDDDKGDPTPTHYAVMTTYAARHEQRPIVHPYDFAAEMDARQSGSVAWVGHFVADGLRDVTETAADLWRDGRGLLTETARHHGITFPASAASATGEGEAASGEGQPTLVMISGVTLASLRSLLSDLDADNCEPERHRTLDRVIAFLGGDIDRAALARFITGIDQ